ncbi:MAG: hypothetical protein ACKESB_01545 [Candidatus Hodgkinia cicadicola]
MSLYLRDEAVFGFFVSHAEVSSVLLPYVVDLLIGGQVFIR